MKNHKRLSRNQNIVEKIYSKGMTAFQRVKYVDAESLFTHILEGDSRHADAWHMRGVCCLAMGRFDEAERFIRKAIEIKKDALFYGNLGITLVNAKKTTEAIAAYHESLFIDPENVFACFNLGNLLTQRQEWKEAEELYRRVIKLRPNLASPLANLGVLLFNRGNYYEAEQNLRRGLDLNPTLPSAAETLGTLLEKTGRVAEATPFFKVAQAWGRLAGNLRMTAAWEDLAEMDTACINDLKCEHAGAALPLQLMNIPALLPKLQYKAALDYANAKYGDALRQPPVVNSVARQGPLRIGYLSADYYDHATMYLMAGVLEAHDPARVEVHLLSMNTHPPQDIDGYTKRIAAMPATFHNLWSASDVQAAEQISKIAPHLLIDLKGYTGGARSNITALRPAPVIVNWLGYPGTLGHSRLADYIIGDPVVTPPEHAGDFSETLALMPHCYQPNDRSRPLSAPPSRKEEGLPENGFVFCCFNQFIKINPGTFDVWCRLLAATPGSVLWLLGKREEGQSNLRAEAEKRGVAADRLIFALFKPLAQHLARLQLADLALDTFPYNSHTTASDALWAGVPLVTRIGQTFASRVAASLLTTHGFPELIAPDDDAYEQLVMSLVNQPERLRQIRQKLDAARLSSPLFDTVRFARDLERLYEAIWQQHSTPRDQREPIVLPP